MAESKVERKKEEERRAMAKYCTEKEEKLIKSAPWCGVRCEGRKNHVKLGQKSIKEGREIKGI